MNLTRLPLAALVALAASPAWAEPSTPWLREGSAELRLVDAGAAPSGGRLAGVEIRLDPGWKTYWRQPGDSGVPPQFDFSGSTNVEAVTVDYPVPERVSDESGVTNVYHGDVLLPVTVRPKDPSAPVQLALVANYGVCDKVCVPARSEATLELGVDGGFAGPAAAAVRRAAAKAPKRVAYGATAEGLAIVSVVRKDGANGQTMAEVVVAAPEGPVQLFAETGAGDYVRAPEPVGPAGAGKLVFRIPFERALPASGFRFTLAAGGAAIESSIPLDAILHTP